MPTIAIAASARLRGAILLVTTRVQCLLDSTSLDRVAWEAPSVQMGNQIGSATHSFGCGDLQCCRTSTRKQNGLNTPRSEKSFLAHRSNEGISPGREVSTC